MHLLASSAVRGRPITLARLVSLAAGGLAALALFAAGGAGAQRAAARADDLRVRDSALAAKSHSTVLELYALESALVRAEGEVAAVDARVAALRDRRRAVARQAAVARETLRVAEARLGERLRDLYQNGTADPVAIVLESGSLDEALSTLEGLQRLASQDRAVMHAVRSARVRFRALSRALNAREDELERARAEAAAEVASLTQTLAARRNYLAELARERALNARRIERLKAAASAAQTRSARLTPSPTPTAAPAPVPVPTPAPGTGERTLTVVATGYALKGTTATGIPTGWGVVAVDPAVIPLGTRMTIPGYGEGIAADVGSAVRGAMIDLWFPSEAQALAWGRRTVTITLH